MNNQSIYYTIYLIGLIIVASIVAAIVYTIGQSAINGLAAIWKDQIMYAILYVSYEYARNPRREWVRDDQGRIILYTTLDAARQDAKKYNDGYYYLLHNQYSYEYIARRLTPRQLARLIAEPHIIIDKEID